MKINKFKKINKNQYELLTDNGLKLKVYENVIIKYNLLVNKDIDDELLNKIDEDNTYYDAYYKAIKYILIKLRTKKEIRYHLKNFDESIIDSVIDSLVKEGYLNDTLYIKSYINDRINLSIDGPNKIRNYLIKLGFKEEEINTYLDEFNDVEERIQSIIDKRLKTNHNKSLNVFKQKISYELYNLGYESGIINSLIENIKFNDEGILEKDIAKLKSKYTDRNIIIKKLLAKGYSYSDILERL